MTRHRNQRGRNQRGRGNNQQQRAPARAPVQVQNGNQGIQPMNQQQVQESSGKQLRQEFWQAMWFPLVVYCIAGYNIAAGYTLFGCALFFFFFARKNLENNATFNDWASSISYAAIPIMVSTFGRAMVNTVHFRKEKGVEDILTAAGPIDGWEDLMISAAIFIRIAHFFLLSRNVEKTEEKTLAVDTIFWFLLAVTACVVHFAVTTFPDIKFETVVFNFSIASMVALALCAPLLYFGLSARQTTVLACVLVVFFYPIVMATKTAVMWQMESQAVPVAIGSYKDMATGFMKLYRTCVGISLGLAFATEPYWNRRPE